MQNNQKIKLIFMGTSDFAVPSLEALYKSNYEIIKVFTSPDKPVGRKQILTPSPVKVKAQELNLDIHQPKTLKSEESFNLVKELNPDLIVVAAYGYILPQRIIDIPRYKCINVHGSLLPEYRGAGPIQWSIINGEEKTGVTVMIMDKGVDTGDILTKAEIKIDTKDTTETLSAKLAQSGSGLLVSTLDGYIEGKISPVKQNNDLATYASMLKKEDGLINWSKSAKEIYDSMRGMYPWPEVYTFFRDKSVKIKWGEPCDLEQKYPAPGEIIEITKNQFKIACGQGAFLVDSVQPEGKKPITAGEFIRGYRLVTGEKFTNSL